MTSVFKYRLSTETSKMEMIFICFALFISAEMLSVQGTVYSSPNTALRFSHCLIEKIGESQVFSFEDRNNMVEVANVMSEALLNQESSLPPRILLTAFVTSMADVITHEDAVKNADRKSFYSAALEQCSLSATGYIDSEFIEMALEILHLAEDMKKFDQSSTLEGSKVEGYKNTNAGHPNVFNPLVVQPSPVRNPQIPGNFNPNDKTDLRMLKPAPDSYPVATNANPFFQLASDFHPVATNTNPLFQAQLATNMRISSVAGAMVESQQKGILGGMPSSNIFQNSGGASISEFSKTAPSFGGLSIPQTKESAVISIPPAVNQQPDKSYPLPQSHAQNGGTVHQPTNMNSAPVPALSVPQAGMQNQNAPFGFSLENIILNTLLESSAFRNAFNFNTPEENAVNLARSITEKSLEGYNLDIINEALTGVSEELTKISFHTPENYALALSNALVRVLKLHNLSLFIDGSQIATSLVSNLESTKYLPAQVEPLGEPSEFVVYPDWSEKLGFDFESPLLEPEDREGEIFSKVLGRYLSKSDKLTDFFCNANAPESKMKTYFSIIKSSLAEYGHQVSSIAASTVSGVLGEMSKEGLCSNYAQTISEVIAEVLDENRVLQGANAENIANQMEFSLIQLNVNPVSQKAESTTVNPPSIADGIPTLQSSFLTNFDDNNNATFRSYDQPSVDYVTSDDKSYRTSDYVSSGKDDNTASNSASTIQMYSKSQYELIGRTTPVTTPYTIEITDEDLTSAATLMEIITTVTDVPPKESSLDWAPGGTIDQEELAHHLLAELESVLDGYSDKDADLEDPSYPSDDVLTTDEVTKDSVQSSPVQPEKNVQIGNITPSGKSEGSPSQTGSDGSTEGISTTPDGNSQDRVLRRSERKGLTNVQKQPSLTESSSVKKDLTELQPSFNVPEFRTNPSSDEAPSEDSLIAAARAMSQIATSSIAYIHSDNFDINILCARINGFASIVNVPPLDYCQEIAAIDYLLNVLKSAIQVLTGV